MTEILKKWRDSSGAERSNAQGFLIDVCRALDVDPPNPATSDPERDDYVFEKPVAIPHEGRNVTIGRIDLYKRGHFVLEAKQGSHEGSRRIGVADRNTPRWQIAMQDAFGQALKYARHVDDSPPFVVVTDVGYCFDLYSAFDGTRNYRPFPDAKSSRLFLSTLIEASTNKRERERERERERAHVVPHQTLTMYCAKSFSIRTPSTPPDAPPASRVISPRRSRRSRGSSKPPDTTPSAWPSS